jgi:FKBP-type peptidyl-prolyl cis-trans isomerase
MMNRHAFKTATIFLGIGLLAILVGVAHGKPLTQKEKDLYYTFGVRMSSELAPYGLSLAALEEIFAGLKDGHQDALRLNPGLYEQELRTHLQGLVKARVSTEEAKGSAFLEVFKARQGVLMTAKGAAYRVTQQGSGPQPTPTSIVHLHYEGRTVDGLVFDSSRGPGAAPGAPPVSFPLDRVIPCWTDVVPQLKAGTKAQIVCPASLAYGARGAPPVIAPGATLIFEVELLSVGTP